MYLKKIGIINMERASRKTNKYTTTVKNRSTYKIDFKKAIKFLTFKLVCFSSVTGADKIAIPGDVVDEYMMLFQINGSTSLKMTQMILKIKKSKIFYSICDTFIC
uniref:SUI1 domain-containing protein n=1 Tax=Strongyloides papillosus TaxID=174720 RepID=A0A0N5B2Q6_STREA